MTQISTEFKSHVIVFKDNSLKFINQGEHNMMRGDKQGGCQGSFISGGFIDFKMIAKWITVEEFYQQYPDRRPFQKYENWTGRSAQERHKITKRREFIEGIIRGLQRYINSTENFPLIDSHDRKVSHQGTKAPVQILARMKQRLEDIKNGKEVDEVSVGGMARGYMGYSPKA